MMIRPARLGDLDMMVSISFRTMRSSYAPFLGVEAVEDWLAGGNVEAFFDEHLTECLVIEDCGDIVGFSVTTGAKVDLLMIDCHHHREGFGRALLAHVEAELFETHPALHLESFAGNQQANAFYAAQGWTPGEPFEDAETGFAMIPFTKVDPASGPK